MSRRVTLNITRISFKQLRLDFFFGGFRRSVQINVLLMRRVSEGVVCGGGGGSETIMARCNSADSNTLWKWMNLANVCLNAATYA